MLRHRTHQLSLSPLGVMGLVSTGHGWRTVWTRPWRVGSDQADGTWGVQQEWVCAAGLRRGACPAGGRPPSKARREVSAVPGQLCSRAPAWREALGDPSRERLLKACCPSVAGETHTSLTQFPQLISVSLCQRPLGGRGVGRQHLWVLPREAEAGSQRPDCRGQALAHGLGACHQPTRPLGSWRALSSSTAEVAPDARGQCPWAGEEQGPQSGREPWELGRLRSCKPSLGAGGGRAVPVASSGFDRVSSWRDT